MEVTVKEVKAKGTDLKHKYGAQVGANWITSTNPKRSASVLVGHCIYVVGQLGLHRKEGKKFSVVGVLDVRNSRWTWLPCEGPGCQAGCLCLYDDALYFFGSQDWKQDWSKDISRYDLLLNEWSYCHSTGENLPSYTGAATAHLFEEREEIFIFGGRTTTTEVLERGNMHLFNIPDRRWIVPVCKGRRPPIRWEHGSCVDRGIYYCFGGWGENGRLEDGMYTMQLQGYTAMWSKPTTSNFLRTLSSFAFIPFKGKLLICGGRPYPSDRMMQYDPLTQEFSDTVRKSRHEFVGAGNANGAVKIDRGRAIALVGWLSHPNHYIVIREES